MTPHVWAKIRNRNRLHQTLAVKIMRQSMRPKQRAGKSSSKTWCPIQTVLTCGKLSKVSTVLLMLTLLTKLCSTTDNGRTITDIKSKANVFINHYARVSKLNMSQFDRDTNRQFQKRIKVPSADDESRAPLLMSELQSAIKKMKGKGAAGPDNIPPSFLKSLGPLALQELLSIFNSSFSLPHCPWIWRVATIIPLLKAGMSPSEVTSFHPISLTSCVIKLLEHILADHLYYIAENNNMFSRFQAGFRKGRSSEDQITQITKAIDAPYWHFLTSAKHTILHSDTGEKSYCSIC